MTTNTPLAPQRYERQLLARYQHGELTIDQVVELLEASIYQVLYHSWTTQQLSENQLQELLEYSRRYNAQHQITGLLLYSSDGRYVQMLEGAEKDVQALYAKIQQDSRHQQVVTVSQGPGPKRQFADWHMDFGQVEADMVEQILKAIQAQEFVPRLSTADPRLNALMQSFCIKAREADADDL